MESARRRRSTWRTRLYNPGGRAPALSHYADESNSVYAIMSVFTCAVVFLLITLTSTLAFPWSQVPTLSQDNECTANDDTQILCQRCAKSTKSNIVYPMCCEDLEEARNWCFHYITFGIQGQ